MDHPAPSSQRKGIFSKNDFSLRQKRILSVVFFYFKVQHYGHFLQHIKVAITLDFVLQIKKMLPILIIEKYYKKWRKNI